MLALSKSTGQTMAHEAQIRIIFDLVIYIPLFFFFFFFFFEPGLSPFFFSPFSRLLSGVRFGIMTPISSFKRR